MTSVRPEDILPNEVNSREVAGVNVRKGTVAAVIANAKLLQSPTASAAEKKAAEAIIKELAPALVAFGLHEVVTFKDPAVQAIVDAEVNAPS